MNETHNKISNKDPHFSVNECRLITLLRQPDLRTPFSTLQTLSGSLSHRLSNTATASPPAAPLLYCTVAIVSYRRSVVVAEQNLPDRTDTYRRRGTWRSSKGEGRSAGFDLPGVSSKHQAVNATSGAGAGARTTSRI